MFERLLYTDCSVGQGYDGTSGYQVQAQSSGTDVDLRGAAMSVQYRVAARWVADRKPVDEFPRSLMHVTTTGIYATGRGRYLGAEVSGSRQTGNFLTDCLLARDADAYGVVRPAQLWQAEFWRDSPWPGTQCPQFPDIDEGELGRDAVVEWLRKDERRGPVLARFLSVLEGATPRVLIRAETPEQALTWIAAATLLLPMARALATSFCVFNDGANDARFTVSALPADLHRDVVPGRQGRTFVIDATIEQSDDVPVSSRAGFWVDKLATCEEPYDVLEAVELAARWSGTGVEGALEEWPDARVTAWAVCSGEAPADDVAALGRWLLRADHALVRAHGDSVSRLLLGATDSSVDVLRVIDALATSRRIGVEPVAARARLLDAEIRLAAAGTACPAEPLPALPLRTGGGQGAVERLVDAILRARDAELDLLLGVSARHGAWQPVVAHATRRQMRPALESRLVNLARSWVAVPATRYEASTWGEAGPYVLGYVADLLADAHSSGDKATLRAALPGVAGDLIGLVGQHGTEFSAQVEAAYAATLGSTDRGDRITQALRHTASDARFALAYQGALADWSLLDGTGALDVIVQLPTTTAAHPRLLDAVLRALGSQGRDPGLAALRAMLRLEIRKDTQGVLDRNKNLRKALGAVRVVRDLVEAAAVVGRGADVARLADPMRGARGLDGAAAQLAGQQLVTTDMQAFVPWLGGVLLRDLPERVATEFLVAWERRLDGADGSVAAAHGRAWLTDDAIPRARKRRVSDELASREPETPGGRRPRLGFRARPSRNEGDS
ncbi:hypothetical protein GCM10027059_37920 [Myceligenerans halotolerans]